MKANPRYATMRRGVMRGDASAVMRFGDDWKGFAASLPEGPDLASMTDMDLCHLFGWKAESFHELLKTAILQWRVSPSRSLINVIARMDGTAEFEGGAIFDDELRQTRAVICALESGLAAPADMKFVFSEDKKPVLVSRDAASVTLTGASLERFEAACRMMRAWELRNRERALSGMVRLPKAIFRGIRGRNVSVDPSDTGTHEHYLHRHAEIAHRRRERILSESLAEVSDSSLLSFTANRRIAETFADAEGFVLQVEPSKVDIVSCWATDSGFDEVDHVLNRHEREFIVRLRKGFVPANDDVAFFDRDYFHATCDPRGIPLVDHETVADFMLDGKRVRSMFVYNPNGVGGSVKYRVGDGYDILGRRTWMKRAGFDPLPGPGREPSDLRYYRVQQFGERRTDIPTISPEEISAGGANPPGRSPL